jgi:CRISPR-associated protein Csb3
MNSQFAPTITVHVDVTNPGQFFACCGLLEFADRLWPGAEGWFASTAFNMACCGTLPQLVEAVASAEIQQINASDPYSSPLTIAAPFRPLSIDWWITDRTGAKDLKIWAGSMDSFGIARAMQQALRNTQFHSLDLFDIGMVVADAENPTKKKEPFYFDARRATNAHSRDIGFSPNDLSLTSIAHPAVELLCLIGLQVARPVAHGRTRIYTYFTWSLPILSNLLLPASSGHLAVPGRQGYSFENWFRTGQKKHKTF